MLAGGECVEMGDWITLDGGTGEVLKGQVNTVQPALTGNFSRLMEWADDIRILGVRANAETPEDAANGT